MKESKRIDKYFNLAKEVKKKKKKEKKSPSSFYHSVRPQSVDKRK